MSPCDGLGTTEPRLTHASFGGEDLATHDIDSAAWIEPNTARGTIGGVGENGVENQQDLLLHLFQLSVGLLVLNKTEQMGAAGE